MLAFLGGKIVRTSHISAIVPNGPGAVEVLIQHTWIVIPLGMSAVLTAIEAVEKVTPGPLEIHATVEPALDVPPLAR